MPGGVAPTRMLRTRRTACCASGRVNTWCQIRVGLTVRHPATASARPAGALQVAGGPLQARRLCSTIVPGFWRPRSAARASVAQVSLSVPFGSYMIPSIVGGRPRVLPATLSADTVDAAQMTTAAAARRMLEGAPALRAMAATIAPFGVPAVAPPIIIIGTLTATAWTASSPRPTIAVDRERVRRRTNADSPSPPTPLLGFTAGGGRTLPPRRVTQLRAWRRGKCVAHGGEEKPRA